MFFSTVKRIYAWFNTRFTYMGRVVFILNLFCGVAGMNTQSNKMYYLFSFFTGLLIIAGLYSRKDVTDLNYEINLPDHTTSGETIEIVFTLINKGKKPIQNLRLNLGPISETMRIINPETHQQYIQILEKDNPTTISWQVVCSKRGVYRFDGLVIEVLDPYGLMCRSHKIPVSKRIVVYPKYYSLVNVNVPVGRRFQRGGVYLSSKVGDSTEFVGVRDFREGDDLSKIHWKLWAKHGNPIVKEFQEEFFVRIALILDTNILKPSSPQKEQCLENAISMAASITDFFGRKDYLIDLFAAGPDLYHITAGRSLAFQKQILEILACVEPSSDHSFPEIKHRLVPALRNTTSVIMIFLTWDEIRKNLVEELLSFDTAIKIICFADSESTPDREIFNDHNVNCTILPVSDREIIVEEI